MFDRDSCGTSRIPGAPGLDEYSVSARGEASVKAYGSPAPSGCSAGCPGSFRPPDSFATIFPQRPAVRCYRAAKTFSWGPPAATWQYGRPARWQVAGSVTRARLRWRPIWRQWLTPLCRARELLRHPPPRRLHPEMAPRLPTRRPDRCSDTTRSSLAGDCHRQEGIPARTTVQEGPSRPPHGATDRGCQPTWARGCSVAGPSCCHAVATPARHRWHRLKADSRRLPFHRRLAEG